VFAVLGLLPAFVAIPAGTAVACSCALAAPEAQVGQADAVFLGTAESVRPGPAGDGLVTIVLRADHVYKGRADAEFEVVTPATSAACGYRFERGGRYLVLAKADDGRLSTGLCSGNRRVPDTGRPLRADDEVEGGALTGELIEALGTPRPVAAASASMSASGSASGSPAAAAAPGRGIDFVGFLLLISPAAAVAALILWLRLRDRGSGRGRP
jgi:Tissue inhibitor of metalloproteinase.